MRFSVILLAVLASAAPAQDTIIVTGKSLQERRAQAEKFVRKAAIVLPGGQFARRDTYCPRIFGLGPAPARIVLAAVRDAAAAAGVKEGLANCRGDLAIVFTANSEALLAALEKRNNSIFRTVPGEDLRAMKAKGRAFRWWYAAIPGGADGAAEAGNQLIGEGADKLGVMAMPTWSASLISTSLKMTLGGSVVLVDVPRNEGQPLASVAAYAAMLSFAQMSPRADFADLPSVLAMRPGDGAGAPPGLTVWDRVYLRELYKLPKNREAWTQRAALAAKMAEGVD